MARKPTPSCRVLVQPIQTILCVRCIAKNIPTLIVNDRNTAASFAHKHHVRVQACVRPVREDKRATCAICSARLWIAVVVQAKRRHVLRKFGKHLRILCLCLLVEPGLTGSLSPCLLQTEFPPPAQSPSLLME